ncbi:MAG: hypothetical protein ABR606_09025 [Vicinamibacterales bacterium]
MPGYTLPTHDKAGSLFCGFSSVYIAQWTGSIARTRRLMSMTGFFGAGMFLLIATRMPDVNTTMMMIAAACFFNDLVMPHSWASCMDVGGKYAGSVGGTMNLMGNMAGATSTMIGGFLLTRTGNDWNLFITILASVYFLGIACWPFIKPDTPIEVTRRVPPRAPTVLLTPAAPAVER